MSDYPNKSSLSGNPKYTVERRKIRIKSGDPRNNALNTLIGDTVIIDDSDVTPKFPTETIEDISLYTLGDVQESTPQPTSLAPTAVAILNAPENLSVDATTFRIESISSTAGDGNVYFTATLDFDDVLGATGYEYIINASE